MLLIDGTFSFATPFCACIFNKHSNALHFILEPGKATDPEYRMYYANDILNKYKSAKCVITSRLHAALPCLALGTPVLLINTQPDQYRFEGLKELTRNC
jgi:exopolysaccharide biosynthesis predicted pyruvyltransferase EpsI